MRKKWRLLGCLLNGSSEYFSENTLFYSTHVYRGRGHVTSPIRVWQRNLLLIISTGHSLIQPLGQGSKHRPRHLLQMQQHWLSPCHCPAPGQGRGHRNPSPGTKTPGHCVQVMGCSWCPAGSSCPHSSADCGSGLLQWEVRECCPPKEYKQADPGVVALNTHETLFFPRELPRDTKLTQCASFSNSILFASKNSNRSSKLKLSVPLESHKTVILTKNRGSFPPQTWAYCFPVFALPVQSQLQFTKQSNVLLSFPRISRP